MYRVKRIIFKWLTILSIIIFTLGFYYLLIKLAIEKTILMVTIGYVIFILLIWYGNIVCLMKTLREKIILKIRGPSLIRDYRSFMEENPIQGKKVN